DRARRNPRPAERPAIYQMALNAALEGIEKFPGNAKSYMQAGQIAIQLKDLVMADSMFTRAQQMYPDYREEVERERANAWAEMYNLGVDALNSGNREEARRFLELADLIDQRRPGARLTLAGIYARDGETGKAIAMYEGVLE